jgi:D-alanyl-D-alanine carboxypeptidase
MVATLVLMLVKDGLLELDRPLSDRLPDLPPEFGRVTVRQCLNHTGGIADYVDHDGFYPALMNEPSKKWRPEELLAFAGAIGPVGRPGERRHYANTNYILLDMAIRRATGSSADRLMTSRIVEPLGLRNTFFPDKADSGPRVAPGYRLETVDEPRWRDYTGFADPSWLGAAGAMISTADDLSVWLRALMAGRFLDKDYRKIMFDWVPAENPEEFAGLGVVSRQGAVGHAGDYVFGHQACMYRRRGRDWVVLTNGTPARLDLLDGATEIFRQLAEGVE